MLVVACRPLVNQQLLIGAGSFEREVDDFQRRDAALEQFGKALIVRDELTGGVGIAENQNSERVRRFVFRVFARGRMPAEFVTIR